MFLTYLILYIAFAAFFGIFLGVMARTEKELKIKGYVINKTIFTMVLTMVEAIGLGLIPFAIFNINVFSHSNRFMMQIPVDQSLFFGMLMILVEYMFIVGVAEEFMIQGFTFNILKGVGEGIPTKNVLENKELTEKEKLRRIKIIKATVAGVVIVLSGVIFSAWHWAAYQASLESYIFAFFIRILWASTYLSIGSLRGIIYTHGFYDAMIVFTIMFAPLPLWIVFVVCGIFMIGIYLYDVTKVNKKQILNVGMVIGYLILIVAFQQLLQFSSMVDPISQLTSIIFVIGGIGVVGVMIIIIQVTKSDKEMNLENLKAFISNIKIEW